MMDDLSEVTLVPRPRFPTAAYGLAVGVWVWVRDQCVCMCVCGCVCDIFQLANYSINLCYTANF